jgi:16S rRNA (adenine1518-N6/adenine1519-N6)-dimethyltransferase
VDSIVLKLTAKEKAILFDKVFFENLIRDSFASKRKNIRNNLKQYNLEVIEQILKKYNKDLTYRAEEITINEFVEISNALIMSSRND